MRNLYKGIFIATLISAAACNQQARKPGNVNGNTKNTAFAPATPAGEINVAISGLGNEQQQVRIRFRIHGRTAEKTFELPLMKGLPAEELYRIVWDAPNSCYVGVVKANSGTRYYHASVGEDSTLKILQSGTPPMAVWQYAENKLKLGSPKPVVLINAATTTAYKKNIQSGKIIADFIINVQPAASPDSVKVYTEFGGARNTRVFAVPAGYKPMVQMTDSQDHCFFVMKNEERTSVVMDIQVKNGRLKLKELNQFIKRK